MLDLFYEGGPLFMGILTLLLLILLILAVRTYTKYNQQDTNLKQARKDADRLKAVGTLALVFGIFGQLLGLYDMFKAIQELENVAPALLAGGLKVSMITTLYGLVIYIISIIVWMGLKSSFKPKSS